MEERRYQKGGVETREWTVMRLAPWERGKSRVDNRMSLFSARVWDKQRTKGQRNNWRRRRELSGTRFREEERERERERGMTRRAMKRGLPPVVKIERITPHISLVFYSPNTRTFLSSTLRILSLSLSETSPSLLRYQSSPIKCAWLPFSCHNIILSYYLWSTFRQYKLSICSIYSAHSLRVLSVIDVNQATVARYFSKNLESHSNSGPHS